MEKEKILNVMVSNLDYEDIENKIIEDIDINKKSFIIAINPEKVLKSRKDAKLEKILNNCNYAIPDGIGIIIASKLKNGNIKKRVTGIDCTNMICRISNERGYKIFLYGAQEEAVSKSKVYLEEKYSNIKIVGYLNGYEKDNNKIIKTINDSKADILFVALGSPKQEFWINDNMSKLNIKVFLGVGGTFDVMSGRIKRAPSWMQKCGLEWLYRLIKEPKRIFRQIKLFEFIYLILIEKIGGKK